MVELPEIPAFWRAEVPEDAAVLLTSVYLFGVALSLYPPAVIEVGTTRVMRLDWLLSVPLVGYASLKWDRTVPLPVRAGIAFLGILVISTAVNTVYNYFEFLTYYVQIIYVVAVFSALVSLRLDADQLMYIYRVWVGILIAMSVYALYQSVALNAGLPLSNLYFGTNPDQFPTVRNGYSRPAALFAEPRWFSAFLLSGIALLIGSIGTGQHFISNRRSEYVALGLLVGAVVLAGSFAGYLSLGALLMVILAVPSTRWVGLQVASVLLFFFVIVVPATAQIGWSFADMVVTRATNNLLGLVSYIVSNLPSRPSGGTTVTEPVPTETPTTTSGTPTTEASQTPPDQQSFRERTSSIKTRFGRALAGLVAWKSNLLLGVGAGQFAGWSAANDVAASVPLQTVRKLDRTHNYWIQLLAMSGLVGVTAVAIIWGSVVRKALAAREAADATERALLVAGLLAIAAEFIDSFWGIGITHPYRWVFLALVYSHARTLFTD